MRRAQTYCILDEQGYCKIGFSSEPYKRIRELQTSHSTPLRLYGVVDENIERYLHCKYAHLAAPAGNEWFVATPAVLAEFRPVGCATPHLPSTLIRPLGPASEDFYRWQWICLTCGHVAKVIDLWRQPTNDGVHKETIINLLCEAADQPLQSPPHPIDHPRPLTDHARREVSRKR